MTDRHRDGYVLTTDRSRVDVALVHRWLSTQSYWATGRSAELVARSIDGSLTYAVLAADQQVAFARVVTDDATYGWICDVFVAAEHRGRGLGGWLVETIVADMTGRGILRLMLATKDAQEVYRRAGFTELAGPGRFMELDLRPTRNAILGL